ncbi:MAG: hypothetical protein IKZ58_05130 [Selenomonadaceae bacterium]|nr:hypothetical protein [Selenomonadaceae bacterium]
METLIIFLLCAVGIFIYLSNKEKNDITLLKEKLREEANLSSSSRKFVSVKFKESDTQLYDYLIGDNYDLKVNDRVEVPISSKFTDKTTKIATVKYVSSDGEYSDYAKSYVIRKVNFQSQATFNKRFVQVIFEEGAVKCYDYLIGDFDVKVGDFVVVHVSDKDSGKAKLMSAQVVYVSAPGEVSTYAKSKIFKKADYKKW